MLRRDVHVPIYWLIVGVLCMVVSPILALIISVRLADSHALERDDELRVWPCELYGSILDAYQDSPPTSDLQRRVRDAYLVQYQVRRCEPPR